MQPLFLKEPPMNHPEDKKSFLSIFEELSKEQNGHSFSEDSVDYIEDDAAVLTDELDHLILMNRDAHFGGDFDVMIQYYLDETGAGIHPDIDLERLKYLASVEAELGKDLAPFLLSGQEAEQVAKARQAYEKLKEVYEIEGQDLFLPRLIADLILSEDEEPQAEIAAVVAQGTRIVPELLLLIKSDEMYNALYPGYGLAPSLAIECLGNIGDPDTVTALFEILGKETLFDELVVLESLAKMGEPAKNFLLKHIQGRPLTYDNTNAAFALTVFADDPEVAIACFEQLKQPEVRDKPLLRTYLLCCCTSIRETAEKEEFIRASEDPNFPPELRSEMKSLIHDWNR